MKTHLAITIGPIYKTLQQARSTREIWASSYIFSWMMKEIMNFLESHDAVDKILAPSPDGLKDSTTYHGAGIFPDRCIVKLKNNFTENDVIALRNHVFDSLLNGKLKDLRDYFHIYVVQGNYADYTDNIIHRMNKIMDNMELQQKFKQKGEQKIVGRLENHIKELHGQGMADMDAIFYTGINPENGRLDNRLPSILEIATKEFVQKEFYKVKVIDAIWKNLRLSKKKQGEKDDEIMKSVKDSLKDEFRFRHKYYAIVQSDGDTIGTTISSIGNNDDGIKEFSETLMTFSKSAALDIQAFGGIPVYIGGDDLLFVAPLMNENGKSLFSFIQELNSKFPSIDLGGATLSFGVSINYYKHPMGEAMTDSYHQLFSKAKKFETENAKKNAIAFKVQKHSGQSFGTVLSVGSESYKAFEEMLFKHKNLEESFLTSMIHTLHTHKYLLVQSVKNNTQEFFFKNHFNESKHSENEKYLNEVRALLTKIATDFKGIKKGPWKYSITAKKSTKKESPSIKKGPWKYSIGETENEDNIIAYTLFSCLRLIQFLNAKDHE